MAIDKKIEAHRQLELSVADVKTIIRSLLALGITYMDISDAAEININTLKQFIHRKSKRPRKAPAYRKLLNFIFRLDESVVKAICQNDTTLTNLFRGPLSNIGASQSDKLTAALSSLQRPLGNASDEYEAMSAALSSIQRAPKSPIYQNQAFFELFYQNYIVLRPAYSGRKIIKSKLQFVSQDNILQFSHFQTDTFHNEYETKGAVTVTYMNLFLVGEFSSKGCQEIFAFKFHPIISDLDTRVESRISKIEKQTSLSGILLTFDSFLRPMACRVALIASKIGEREIFATDAGAFDFDALTSDERRVVLEVSKEIKNRGGSSFFDSLPPIEPSH